MELNLSLIGSKEVLKYYSNSDGGREAVIIITVIIIIISEKPLNIYIYIFFFFLKEVYGPQLLRSLGLSCYRHLNQLLNNKQHCKRKGNHFKIPSPIISSSEVVGMEGDKNGATVGEKNKQTTFIFAGFSTSTKLFFQACAVGGIGSKN